MSYGNICATCGGTGYDSQRGEDCFECGGDGLGYDSQSLGRPKMQKFKEFTKESGFSNEASKNNNKKKEIKENRREKDRNKYPDEENDA